MERFLKSFQYIKNYPLGLNTQVKAGGLAKFFVKLKNTREMEKLFRVITGKNIPFYILGAGSKIIVSDEGVDFVIKFDGGDFKIVDFNTNTFGSAIGLPFIINQCIKIGKSGFESFAGIPASIGGALYMNLGAFGKSMSDIVDKVIVWDIREKKYIEIKASNIEFGYRYSVFQNKPWIIIKAKFNLKSADPLVLRQKVKEIIEKRKRKQPLDYPSFGSAFKNPSRDISAGSLIEKCGLKGFRIGNACVSQKHANFIINLGGAKASDILEVTYQVKKKVYEMEGISLKPEFILWGNWDKNKEEFLWKR